CQEVWATWDNQPLRKDLAGARRAHVSASAPRSRRLAIAIRNRYDPPAIRDARAMTAEANRGGPPSRHHRLSLIGLAAASGCAGLGYEIVWMRQFSLALGTEMMAVLGSIAGFFAGLALGAFALDGRIRRASSARQAYALLEAVIGGWGVCAIWLLPAAGR